MDEIVEEFLVERYESLDRLECDLAFLEKDPPEKESLGGIFRAIHTFKGTSVFLGYTKLEAVAHLGENLLSKLRNGVIARLIPNSPVLNEGDCVPAITLLAPITAPSTAVAVPASRSHAAVDPQTVAVVAPFPSHNPSQATSVPGAVVRKVLDEPRNERLPRLSGGGKTLAAHR